MSNRNLFQKIKHWFRRRLDKRYHHHVVYTDLTPYSWADADLVMERAMVALLFRYVDWELEERYTGQTGMEVLQTMASTPIPTKETQFTGEIEYFKQYTATNARLLAAYSWFKYERPRLEKRADNLWTSWKIANEGISFMRKEDGVMIMGWPNRPDIEDERTKINDDIEKGNALHLTSIFECRHALWT